MSPASASLFPRLFVSYRRSQRTEVQAVVDLLGAAGVDCFLDVEDIEALADFPDAIRAAIDGSHAFLAWWSLDYAASEYCLAEFHRAWQHSRRRSSDIGRRLWILNPEPTADHILAGELNAHNFLSPPAAATEAWAQDLRRRLDALCAEGPLADEREQAPPPSQRNVTLPSPNFVGRGETLLRIHSRLFPPRIEARSLAPALQLHGMAGVGKTEVAAAYANTFALAYPGGVFWLNLAGFHPPLPVDETAAAEAWSRALHAVFAREPTLQRALLHGADGMPLSPVAVRESVSRWLAVAPGPYLWILDNVPFMSPLDGRDRVFEWLRAPTPGGRTMVTTRDSRIATGFTEESLDVLDEVTALALLARYRSILQSERDSSLSLVRRVGGHTLAIVLLGEHLRQGEGYAAMLQRLLNVGLLERLEVIAELLRPELGERARSVVAAFSLSVNDLLPDAKRLLGLAAMCAPVEPIPDELLRAAFGGDELADRCTIALRALMGASLLARRRGDEALEIHPLAADVAYRLLEVRVDREGASLAEGLLAVLPAVADVRRHAELVAYVAHARHLVQPSPWDERSSILLGWAARFDQERGAYASAEALLRQQLAFCSQRFGAQSLQALYARGDLSRALRGLGRVDEAIAEDVVVLRGRRRSLGREHIDTLTAMNNLATALSDARRTRQALRILERLLKARRRTLGPQHAHTLFTLNNLGAELMAAGRPQEARPFVEEAYRVRKELYGWDSEHTSASAVNLATVLQALGDVPGALELMRQVVGSRTRLFGSSHPKVLALESVLGRLLIAKGDAEAARELLESTLARAAERLGSNDKTTLLIKNNLGKALLNLGRLDAARLLLEQATAGWAQEADPSDPTGLRFAINLLATLLRQGEEDQARRIFDLHLRALWRAPRLAIDPAVQELIADLDLVLKQHPQLAEVLRGT